MGESKWRNRERHKESKFPEWGKVKRRGEDFERKRDVTKKNIGTNL